MYSYFRRHHHQGGHHRHEDVLHPGGDRGHCHAEWGRGHISQRWILLWRDMPADQCQEGGQVCSTSDNKCWSSINTYTCPSVRAETYCNLFSLSVDHFNAVLESYPLMRRTMESIAAERWADVGNSDNHLLLS